MDSTDLQTPFRLMGARVRFSAVPQPGNEPVPATSGEQLLRSLRIDILRDGAGEYFDVSCDRRVQVDVADVRPDDRHLLLTAAAPGAPRSAFLCGHDEKSWFVAAIPEDAGASDVQEAKDALKPQEVWDAMRRFGVPPEKRDARKTAAFVRQGEWFFIPRPSLEVNWRGVLRDEPIRRGAGKPHVCQFLHRAGEAELVYVNDEYPNGLTAAEYWGLPFADRGWSNGWRRMSRNAHVYAKGNVRHPDHKTVFLQLWHEVVGNTETLAAAMSQVAFLD